MAITGKSFKSGDNNRDREIAGPWDVKSNFYRLAAQSKIIGDSTEALIGNTGDAMNVYSELSGEYIDAFSRLRVGSPASLFEQSHRSGKHALYWDEKITGSASSIHYTNKASVELNTTTASGDKIERQTFRRFRYFPGKGQSVVFTGSFLSEQANIKKQFGLFDPKDGIFFQLDGSTLSVVIRSYVTGSAVDTVITQDNWNIDKMDGTGDSGITIDTTKQIIFVISFQWLGSGQIKFGFNIGGVIYFCHAQNHSNLTDVPFSSTADLPLRAVVENTAAPSSGGEMQVTCWSVMSDGGDVDIGRVWSINNDATEVTITTSETALLALRLKSTYARYSIKPLNTSFVMTTATGAAIFFLYYQPSVTASWTSINSESISEYAAGTAITAFSGGTVIDSDYIPSGGSKGGSTSEPEVRSDVFLGCDIDETVDALLLTAKMISGNGKILSGMTLREYF